MITRKFMNESILKKNIFKCANQSNMKNHKISVNLLRLFLLLLYSRNSYLISEIIIFYGIDNLGHTQINV